MSSAAIQGKYYALSAAAALFKFFESHNSLQFSPGTLKIKYAPLEGTMLMDGDSVKNLELIENVSVCLLQMLLRDDADNALLDRSWIGRTKEACSAFSITATLPWQLDSYVHPSSPLSFSLS